MGTSLVHWVIIFYASQLFISDAQGQQEGCGLDIVIVIDASCSIAPENGDKIKTFIVDFTRQFDIGPGADQTQMSAITFNIGSEVQYYLKDATGNATAVNLAQNIDLTNLVSQEKCQTNTFDALEKVRTDLLNTINGNRPDVPDVMVLLTDGVTVPVKFKGDTIAEAKKLKDIGVINYVISLPNEKGTDGRSEFSQVASSIENIFSVDNFDRLGELIETVQQGVCESSEDRLCPKGFLETGDKGSCQAWDMNGCDKKDKRCCGCSLTFADSSIGGVPQWPVVMTRFKKKCLCEKCLKKKCIPKQYRNIWKAERIAAGLSVK